MNDKSSRGQLQNKVKQSLDRQRKFQEVWGPWFQESRQVKVVRLTVLRTGRIYSPGNIPGTHFCSRLSRPQGHSEAGRIMSMWNSNDTIGNRTRDLPACSSGPQQENRIRKETLNTGAVTISVLQCYLKWCRSSPDNGLPNDTPLLLTSEEFLLK